MTHRDWEIPSDFEWEEPSPAPPPKAEFYCRDANGNLVEAGLYFQKYTESILADTEWPAKMAQRKQTKQERKAERDKRLAERRERKRQRSEKPS